MDKIDKTILAMLQENARETNITIASRLKMAQSAIFQRIKKLERLGVIKGYTTVVDKEALGLHLMAFIFIRTKNNYPKDVENALIAHPNVLEVHSMAGEYCYLAKVIVKSPKHLIKILKDDFSHLEEIIETNSKIVFETNLENGAVPT